MNGDAALVRDVDGKQIVSVLLHSVHQSFACERKGRNCFDSQDCDAPFAGRVSLDEATFARVVPFRCDSTQERVTWIPRDSGQRVAQILLQELEGHRGKLNNVERRKEALAVGLLIVLATNIPVGGAASHVSEHVVHDCAAAPNHAGAKLTPKKKRAGCSLTSTRRTSQWWKA